MDEDKGRDGSFFFCLVGGGEGETRGPMERASLSGICQHGVSSANASTSSYSVATSSVSPITIDDFGRVCRDDGKFCAWLDVGAPSEEGAWEYGNPRAEGGLNDRAETILCCGSVFSGGAEPEFRTPG